MPVGITYGSTAFSRQYNKINASGTVAFKNDLRHAGHAFSHLQLLTQT